MSDENTQAPEAAPDNIDETIEREPEFYYSRERRLNKASAEVRALNDGKIIKPSFRKTLFAARGNVMIFVSIVAIIAMFGMVSRLRGREYGLTIGGNAVEMTIHDEEGALLLSLKKTASKKDAYTGDVDIAVSPVMPKPEEGDSQTLPPMFAHSFVFHSVETEEFHVSLPFTEKDYFVIIRTGGEQKTTRLNVE